MAVLTDSLTSELTAGPVFALLVAAVLAFPVSLLLLALYRRAVVRQMTRIAAGALPSPAPAGRAGVPNPRAVPLVAQVTTLSDAAVTRSAPDDLARDAVRDLRRSAAIHLTGGGALAVVQAATYLMSSGAGFAPLRFLLLTWLYAWPSALAYGMVAGLMRRTRALTIIVYLLGYALLGSVVLGVNPTTSVAQLAEVWLITNVVPTVLLAAFLVRRVRAVGPLVLLFTFLAVVGTFWFLGFIGANQTVLAWIDTVSRVLPLPRGWSVVAVLGGSFLAFGLVGWGVLLWIGHHYATKRTSDQMLTLNAMFLLFSTQEAVDRVFNGWYWAPSAFLGFVAYKLASAILFRLAGYDRKPPGRQLLLLRVFAPGSRGIRLFDLLGRVWQRQGVIAMIAGPDLATATVEPHEFLGFLSGRLRRRFIRDQADLRARLSDVDRRPDPDGRFRVTELFCHENTWRDAVAALVAESDAVLMDLRGFSRQNQGCIYELGLLLDVAPLATAVLLVDNSTDETFLWERLQQQWQQLPPWSPNAGDPVPRVRIGRASGHIESNVYGVLRVLSFASGKSSGVAPGGEAA